MKKNEKNLTSNGTMTARVENQTQPNYALKLVAKKKPNEKKYGQPTACKKKKMSLTVYTYTHVHIYIYRYEQGYNNGCN